MLLLRFLVWRMNSFSKYRTEQATSSVCPLNVTAHRKRSRLRKKSNPQGVALTLVHCWTMAGDEKARDACSTAKKIVNLWVVHFPNIRYIH